ncbi:hypothetical protein J6590_031031 [Homalodisca vitripennis]|nr:hypothetical protein J6590_031031 [Homalodisca vitripennis]
MPRVSFVLNWEDVTVQNIACHLSITMTSRTHLVPADIDSLNFRTIINDKTGGLLARTGSLSGHLSKQRMVYVVFPRILSPISLSPIGSSRCGRSSEHSP